MRAEQEETGRGGAAGQSASGPSVVLVGTFTVDPLVAPLERLIAETRMALDVKLAPYGQVFQELLDPAGLFSQNVQGVNVILVRLEDWLATSSDHDALHRSIQELVAGIRRAAEASATPQILCLCHPSSKVTGDVELAELISSLEGDLINAVAGLPSVHVVGRERLGPFDPESMLDVEADQLGHIPYRPLYFAALASAIARIVYASKNPPYKVLVLDCDNTLWKGVVGEDGVHGIEITPAHRAVQQFALEQKQAGKVLCVASKNIESDVLSVFRERTDMLLREEDVLVWRVNWLPKSQNLKTIADELNLGVDSFALVDDNPLECADCVAHCPGVLAIQLPAEGDLGAFLRGVWPLDHLRTTDEDRRRTELYRQNLDRNRHWKAAGNLSDFIAGLEIQIDISKPTGAQLARTAQLTQRTNQFNFTTVRRTEAEIEHLEQEGKECLIVEVKDRFGDYGLVGLMIFGDQDGSTVIDTFLLSCRVLGRGVEHAMIREIGRRAQRHGHKSVVARFAPTKKNLPALHFLQGAPGAVAQPSRGGETSFVFPVAVAADLAFVPTAAVLAPTSTEPVRVGRISTILDEEKSARWNRIARELDSPQKIAAAVEKARRGRRTVSGELVPPKTPNEQKLARIWTEVLGISAVGIRDDYFALGGTSLQAVSVMARVGREIGSRLPLAALIECPTIETLAARLTSQHSQVSSSLVLLQEGGSAPPLFLVHDADGETLLYRNLAQRFAGERPVYGIQPESRDGVPIAQTRIEEMAAHYVAEIQKVWPDGPYLLGGLCAGGILAFEMARQLEAMNKDARLVALFDAAHVDASRKPHVEMKRRFARVSNAVGDSSFLSIPQVLARKATGYVAFEIGTRLRRASEKMTVATLRLCVDRGLEPPSWAKQLSVRTVYLSAEAKYRPTHGVREEIVLFRATNGEGTDEPYLHLFEDPLLGWGGCSEKGVVPIDVRAGHSSMLQEPHVVEVAAALRRYLRDGADRSVVGGEGLAAVSDSGARAVGDARDAV